MRRSGWVGLVFTVVAAYVGCGDSADEDCAEFAQAACAAACACADDPADSCGFYQAGADVPRTYGGGGSLTPEEFCAESFCRKVSDSYDYAACRDDVNAETCEQGGLLVDAACMPSR